MLYAFLVVLILLMLRYFKYYLICRRQEMVSDLADSRRELINLVDKGIIDPRSEVFKFYYKMFEVLIRIRYFKKDHLLPKPFQIVRTISATHRDNGRNGIKIEMAELQKKRWNRRNQCLF